MNKEIPMAKKLKEGEPTEVVDEVVQEVKVEKVDTSALIYDKVDTTQTVDEIEPITLNFKPITPAEKSVNDKLEELRKAIVRVEDAHREIKEEDVPGLPKKDSTITGKRPTGKTYGLVNSGGRMIRN